MFPSAFRLLKRSVRDHGAIVHQVRRLSLQECHSHKLLQEFDIPVPRGHIATTAEEARTAIANLGGNGVIKSQILAGGRGKGKFASDQKAGIRVINSADEAFENASLMIGNRLMTKQTSADGLPVDKLYVTEQVAFSEEFYLAMAIDREKHKPVILMSQAGGVNVEANAEELHKFWFSLTEGITSDLLAGMKTQLNLSAAESEKLAKILTNLFDLFKVKDAVLLEINPLVRSNEGQFLALDAKFRFDDAARHRQPDLFALEEVSEETQDEHEASKYGLVYVNLDGDIGNIVNGAGLAMATNDAISHYGGKSANFLDTGGQATKATMLKAFEIVNRDPRVKSILVNIYGGIIRCDMIAESIIAAAAELGSFRVPVVIRLQGTNSEKGLKLIKNSGIPFHTEADFGSASNTAVELAAANSC